MPGEGVLILECLDESDPGSEGMFLSHMFNLMEVSHQYVEVRTKYQLLSLLMKPPYTMVHITTHGSVRGHGRKENFRGLWAKDGNIRKTDLAKLERKLDGFTVVSTACLSGDQSFAEDFVQVTDCDHYIAPLGSPTFKDAIFFAHIFYHKCFVLGRPVAKIMREYDSRYKNPHNFHVVSFEDFIKESLDEED